MEHEHEMDRTMGMPGTTLTEPTHTDQAMAPHTDEHPDQDKSKIMDKLHHGAEQVAEHMPSKEQAQRYGRSIIESAKKGWHTLQEKTPDSIRKHKARTAAIGVGSYVASRIISGYRNRRVEVTLPLHTRTLHSITGAPRRAMAGTREYIHNRTA